MIVYTVIVTCSWAEGSIQEVVLGTSSPSNSNVPCIVIDWATSLYVFIVLYTVHVDRYLERTLGLEMIHVEQESEKRENRI